MSPFLLIIAVQIPYLVYIYSTSFCGFSASLIYANCNFYANGCGAFILGIGGKVMRIYACTEKNLQTDRGA
jgi:hypothetical protein